MFVDSKEVTVGGRLARIAGLRAEYYEWVDDPDRFVEALKRHHVDADLFTFLQRGLDRKARYGYHCEPECIAVLPITTYEAWWKKQINDKTRNMVRKAHKSGVEVREVSFDDALIRGIQGIYDEAPLRQGNPFKHYGKDLATLRRDHESFLDRSQFVGAFSGEELIGFIKLVHDDGISRLMQIISKIAQRNKAPTNALIAKAVELCAERGVPYLHYGVWSRRSLGDFKMHHAFAPFDVPRYFVPLNVRGTLILRLGLHRKLAAYLPGDWVDRLVGYRSRWNSFRYGRRGAASR